MRERARLNHLFIKRIQIYSIIKTLEAFLWCRHADRRSKDVASLSLRNPNVESLNWVGWKTIVWGVIFSFPIQDTNVLYTTIKNTSQKDNCELMVCRSITREDAAGFPNHKSLNRSIDRYDPHLHYCNVATQHATILEIATRSAIFKQWTYHGSSLLVRELVIISTTRSDNKQRDYHHWGIKIVCVDTKVQTMLAMSGYCVMQG
jgi:hypothetical protein